MKKRSPPPPPDRPLNIHSTAYRPSHNFTEPNWGKWKLCDNVPLWIAACLLSNIDPPADTYELDGYPANFKEIWNIINSDGDFANVPNLPLDGRRKYVASLRGFAAWAINKGIENIPETMLEWGHQRLKLLAEIKAMPEQNIEPVTSAASPPASKPQAAAASEPVTCASVPSTKYKLRTNSLDVPIKKAITEAESFETGAVYLKLREMALSGELPFSGEIENGALCYTNDTGKPDKLTKDALGKRLKKYRR